MGRKILVIGPAWVGDMVMAQCLFKLIKQSEPHAQIDVLAPDWTFALLNRMPDVHRAIIMPIGHGTFGLIGRYQLAKSLEKYDQAIVLPNSWKSALIPFLANIPKRTGWVGEWRYGLLNDIRKLDKKRYPLMIERFMALGLAKNSELQKPYPHPIFHIQPDAQNTVLEKIKPLYRGRPIIALAPGAAFGPSKQWPITYFAEIANAKISEGFDVWIFGSIKDKDIADELMSLTNNNCENLAGRIELDQTIDLLSLTSGVVSNDSGLLHIAAALNKPLIAIYGSTSPEFTPPLSDDTTILKLNLDCQPCFQRTCPLKHHRCMRDLHAQRVLNAMSHWSLK